MYVITLLHVISAVALTMTSVGIFFAAIIRHRLQNLYVSMKLSFALTLFSGVFLIFMKPGSLTHFCIMMTIYTVGAASIGFFYEKRSATSTLS